MAAIVAESWVGAAQGAQHAICLWVGDRVFAGLMLDGKPWTGAHGLAGSAAWLALNPVERQDYRRFGSLAAEVSNAGIARRFCWRIESGDRSAVLDEAGGLEKITADHVLDGARSGDGVAISVVRDTAKYLGMAIANLASAIDPDVIVLGRRSGRGRRSAVCADQAGVRAPAAARRSCRSFGWSCRRSARTASPSVPRGWRRSQRHDPPRPARRSFNPAGSCHRERSSSSRTASPTSSPASSADAIDLAGHYIVPGFIDVHVHGVLGHRRARRRRCGRAHRARACRDLASRRFARRRSRARQRAARRCSLRSATRGRRPMPGSARVLPAHLESNFINPEFKGAQPRACLRAPGAARGGRRSRGADILDEIERARADVGIVTVAPEIDGVARPDPVTWCAAGHRVSLGHSGATYEQAMAAVAAGARHATHLFNRMSAFSHRAPGLAGAVLDSDDDRRRDHLRRRARASGGGAHGRCRKKPVARDGDHRRNRRLRPLTRRHGVARRTPDYGRRRRVPGRRHDRRQRADDGPRVREARDAGGVQPGRRGA